jgi:glycosyltransferase involved in cell wall biosynthesis
MKVGIAGPISLRMLADRVSGGERLPEGYSFPFIAQLVRALLDCGHAVSVFALDPCSSQVETWCGPGLKVHVCPMRARARNRALDCFAAERTYLGRAMSQDPCEVIHAHWTYEFALAALRTGRPTLVTVHDAPWRVLRFLPNLYRLLRLGMAWLVARRAQHLSAVSPYVAEHFRRYLGFRRKIHVIPNGLSESCYAPGPISGERGGNCTFAATLTGWGKLKNAESLLRAFQLTRRVLPQAKLLLFGYGYGAGEAADLWAAKNGLAQGVEFVGQVPHQTLIRRLRNEVNIYVHPALEECCPLSVLEAMALGLPVIGGETSGGVPFVLGNGEAGVLVDVRAPSQVAAKMVALAQDTALRAEKSRAAWEKAAADFRIRKIVQQYTDLYGRISARG